jgi:hypothetical protein
MLKMPEISEEDFKSIPEAALTYENGHDAPAWIKQRSLVFRRDDVINTSLKDGHPVPVLWTEPLDQETIEELDNLYDTYSNLSDKYGVVINFHNHDITSDHAEE